MKHQEQPRFRGQWPPTYLEVVVFALAAAILLTGWSDGDEVPATLPMPALVITGSGSTASAHGVASRLIHALRQVEHVELSGLGHMGPITHPDVVNAEVERFLSATA